MVVAATLGLCLAASPSASLAQVDPDIADVVADGPFAGLDCEVHVWASGRPNFVPKSNAFVRVIPPTPDQLADPYSTVNVFNATNRAMALSDEALANLFPGAASLSVIRHEEVIDIDETPIKSFKGRIADSDTECYGDLIVRSVTGVFPNPDTPYQQYGIVGGLLASAIIGDDRIVMDFWFRQWPGKKMRADKPLLVKRRNDTPLAHVEPGSEDMLAAATDAANANLVIFAETVAKKRR